MARFGAGHQERLDAISQATAHVEAALKLLEDARVRNKKLLSALNIVRHECAQQERDEIYAETRSKEREREECRQSINS